MSGKIKWICPHCESKTYTTIVMAKYITSDKNKIDCMFPIGMYMCDRCSRMFGDPDKFNLVTDLDYDKQLIETRRRNDEKTKRK